MFILRVHEQNRSVPSALSALLNRPKTITFEWMTTKSYLNTWIFHFMHIESGRFSPFHLVSILSSNFFHAWRKWTIFCLSVWNWYSVQNHVWLNMISLCFINWMTSKNRKGGLFDKKKWSECWTVCKNNTKKRTPDIHLWTHLNFNGVKVFPFLLAKMYGGKYLVDIVF